MYFLVGHYGEVGPNFVGETERCPLAPKNDYQCICALRHKVGEIDPYSLLSRNVIFLVWGVGGINRGIKTRTIV